MCMNIVGSAAHRTVEGKRGLNASGDPLLVAGRPSPDRESG
jgi:hypothetical protein